MKEIRAYIQPHKLSQLTMALMEIPDFPGISVSECEGFGREHTRHVQDYRPFLSRLRLEIFAPDEMADLIFTTIMSVARSGNHGDGKVYLLDVVEGARIATGERSADMV